MRSNEGPFGSGYEKARRMRNEQTANQLAEAIKSETLNIDDFKTDENADEIARDHRYIEETKKHFEDENGYHAKALERIFYFNVSQQNWLCDITDKSYESEAIAPTDYDDYRNRIDLATTVHTEEGPRTFGIDITTNPDPDVIRKKILFASNDPNFDAPAGFGQLKYYADSTGYKGKLGPIPRYCIGINREAVDDILDSTKITSTGVHFGKLTPVEQFKILQEMSAQNELFETPLYAKEEEGTLTEEEEQCLRYIETLDAIYLDERARIAKLLPPWALKKGTDFGSITECLLDPENEPDETFASILAVTEELYQDASDPDDPDKLKKAADRYKRRENGSVKQELGNTSNDIMKKVS